jgi:hypothetical protein
MFLFGEICSKCDVCFGCTHDQLGTWLIKESGRPEELPAGASEEGSTQQSGIARKGAIPSVIGQKSAEAIVGEDTMDETFPKGRTRLNREEP